METYYATESTLTDRTSTIHARKGKAGKTLCGRNATANYLITGHFAVTVMQFAKMRAEYADTSMTEIVSCLRCENAMVKAGA